METHVCGSFAVKRNNSRARKSLCGKMFLGLGNGVFYEVGDGGGGNGIRLPLLQFGRERRLWRECAQSRWGSGPARDPGLFRAGGIRAGWQKDPHAPTPCSVCALRGVPFRKQSPPRLARWQHSGRGLFFRLACVYGFKGKKVGAVSSADYFASGGSPASMS